jgi:peptidoglycan/xylan/chitin deacetylase (PgdA/CDA1 family)
MKTFAVTLLLFSTFILFGLGFGTNYHEELSRTLVAIKTAKTLDELASNPFSPAKTFQNFLRKPINNKSICKAFQNLAVKDLALLENFLIENKNELKITCFDLLMQKITRFHSVQNTMFFGMAEKDRSFLQQGGSPEDMTWSPLNQIIPVGEKLPFFFKGTTTVTRSSVIYQRDLTTTSPDINKLYLEKGEIILSFDDGPHPTRTQQVLKTLKHHQVHALFFAIGSKAKEYPAIIKEVLNQDNIYGSHSNTHQKLPDLSELDAKEEIRRGHLNVTRASNGEDSGFFRFPYGARNTNLAQYLKTSGWSSFFWNMDSLDWKYSEPLTLYNNIVSEINREQKGIILFHDVHQQTVTVLNTVLENLYNAGYSIRIAVPIEWTETQDDETI